MLVGLSIPFCFLMTYLILYTLDMEVNFLVMMGLLLGMGMLIDGSIVITEYADKKIAEGLSRVEGYTLASKRMFYPIIASTGTTLAAFIPMMFWPGFTGQFMKYLPITIFFVLSASLFYSLIVIPVLGAYFGQRESALNNDETNTSIFVRYNIERATFQVAHLEWDTHLEEENEDAHSYLYTTENGSKGGWGRVENNMKNEG